MKYSAKQYTDQYIIDAKQYIDGNIAEHLICNVQSEENGYYSYLSDEEIEEYENCSRERKNEIEQSVESFINENYNYDISEFIYGI